MAVNGNVTRINDTSLTLAQADLDDINKYTLVRASTERIVAVADPIGERGFVAKITRRADDPLVNGSHRTEMVRDKFFSEYAFKTGGGVYWGSYLLDPEWLAKHHLLEASVPSVTDYSINIMQFHPRNTDLTVHPKFAVVVNEFGVSLRQWKQSDAAFEYDLVVTWPVDSLVWHDVVCNVVWSDSDGYFELYLDDRRIYNYIGPTVYPGATAGCWRAEGIYAPGGFPAGIDELTIYTQGMRQAYPPGPYSLCRGVSQSYTRQVETRSSTTRTLTDRTVTARNAENT